MLDAATGSTFRGPPSWVGMREWLSILGHSDRDIDNLNVVHVAGTKGKGSTCSMIATLLHCHGKRTGSPKKIGLYTTPLLNRVTDMWRLNGVPISDEDCINYFAEVCDLLPCLLDVPAISTTEDADIVAQGPGRLQLQTLIAFHIFIRERVDAAVIECVSGGECDSTNVVQSPIATTVTPLGMDHVGMLGPSLENIAWHKAGIYKRGAAALARRQAYPEIDTILQRRAEERGCQLMFVDKVDDPRLPRKSPKLDPDIVRENVVLALATTDAFLERPIALGRDSTTLTALDVQHALQMWEWKGRFQIVQDGSKTFYMDGAHNEMSVPIAIQWFARHATASEPGTSIAPLNIVVFAQISATRDPASVFRVLARSCIEQNMAPDHVVITSNLAEDRLGPKSQHIFETLKTELPAVWHEEDPTTATRVEVISTLTEAMRRTDELVGLRCANVLLTGSVSAIGQLLKMMEGDRSPK